MIFLKYKNVKLSVSGIGHEKQVIISIGWKKSVSCIPTQHHVMLLPFVDKCKCGTPIANNSGTNALVGTASSAQNHLLLISSWALSCYLFSNPTCAHFTKMSFRNPTYIKAMIPVEWKEGVVEPHTLCLRRVCSLQRGCRVSWIRQPVFDHYKHYNQH